jgi:uncharacterized repeat protein (TIGR01451 family)
MFNARVRQSRLAAVLIPVIVAALAMFASQPGANAQTSTAHIQTAGPWTDIWLGSDLSCQVATSPTGDQFYPSGVEPGDCGTMLAAGGSVYAPGFLGSTTFTETSQTGVTGDGTANNPYTVVTDVAAGDTGLTLEETDTYVAGDSEFHTTVTIANASDGSQDAILYHAADCYVGGSDLGFGTQDGAVGCQSQAGDTVEFVPTTTGSHYLEAYYSTVWSAVGSGSPFGNTCDCTTYEDNGLGLSWSTTVPASGSVSISFATRWTAGTAAASADLAVAKSDTAEGFGPDPVSSGGVVAYEVTATNNGPDDATGIVVQDSASGGTIVSASGGSDSGWDCTSGESGWSCALGGLAAGSSAPPITVLVQAPTTTTNTTISDTATISGDQSDPNGDNNSATETTTVTGSGTSSGKDNAGTYYDSSSPVTIQTSRNDTFSSQLTVPPGLDPGVVSIQEVPGTTPQYATFCGGQTCRPQLQVFDVPNGTASATNPIKDILFYSGKYKKGGPLYAAGEGETTGQLVPTCTTPGIADPAKCIDSVRKLPGGVVRITMLMRGGSDPAGRH